VTTYTSEAYTATNGLTIMWTYVFSDGEKWTKMDEEYLDTAGQWRRRTRVFVQDFEGDTERRSTLKALTAKTSTATMTSHTVIDGRKELADTTTVDGGTVPAAPNAAARAKALTEAEAEHAIELPTYQPGDRVHHLTSPAVYTVVKHRNDGKVNLRSTSGRALTLPDGELSAAATREERREEAIATAKAEDAAPGRFDTPEARTEWLRAFPESTPETPARLSYVKTTKWMGTDPAEDLYTNVYTYAFNDGMTYVKREAKDIVLGGFTQTVHRTGPDGRTVKSTLRELNQRVEQADAAARAEEKAQRAASAPAPKPRPAYVIEPGYEEQAHPMTARQEAVLTAIHKELGLRYALDVLPPVKGNGDLTASADSPSGRVFMEIDPEGYISRVAARYEFAGFTGWATLDSADSDLALRVKEIARAARLATPVITAGTNAAE
jgi:hypothetical protein